MPKQIAKKDLSTANQRFDTQRARYLYLTKLGYSQAQIAEAYGVSKRAVWQALHAAAGSRRRAGRSTTNEEGTGATCPGRRCEGRKRSSMVAEHRTEEK